MKNKQMTPGQIRQLIEIDDARQNRGMPGIHDEVQNFIRGLTVGGIGANASSASFVVSVDRSFTLLRMIEAGAYHNHDHAVKELTEERFPVDRSGKLIYDKELSLVAPSRNGLLTTEWWSELKANEWELEQVPEMLALGAKYPALARKYRIIAFGSLRDTGGCLLSPNLRSYYRRCCTDTVRYFPSSIWGDKDRALVSRKQKYVI